MFSDSQSRLTSTNAHGASENVGQRAPGTASSAPPLFCRTFSVSAELSVYRVVLPPDLRDLVQEKGVTLPLKWWTGWGGKTKQRHQEFVKKARLWKPHAIERHNSEGASLPCCLKLIFAECWVPAVASSSILEKAVSTAAVRNNTSSVFKPLRLRHIARAVSKQTTSLACAVCLRFVLRQLIWFQSL